MRFPEEYYKQQGYLANKNLTHRLMDNPYQIGFEQHTRWSMGWYKYAQEMKELATMWIDYDRRT